jgi:hypothetical protein
MRTEQDIREINSYLSITYSIKVVLKLSCILNIILINNLIIYFDGTKSGALAFQLNFLIHFLTKE